MLDANRDHPDCVFVEDTAIVLDEIAVMMSMGAQSRRDESRRASSRRYAPIARSSGCRFQRRSTAATSSGGPFALRRRVSAHECRRASSSSASSCAVRLLRDRRAGPRMSASQVSLQRAPGRAISRQRRAGSTCRRFRRTPVAGSRERAVGGRRAGHRREIIPSDAFPETAAAARVSRLWGASRSRSRNSRKPKAA